MKFNKAKLVLASALVFSFGMTGCSDWTEARPEQMTDYDNTEIAKPESYFEALRAYKKTEHSIAFGWYADWVDANAATTNMLAGIPDSMDVVSLWGGWSNLNEGRWADVRLVQEKKGMKVMPCTFTTCIGNNFTPEEFNGSDEARHEFWGWVNDDPEAIEGAIRKYAHAMLDTIAKYNYDGIDIDYEPHFGYGGELSSYNDRMHILIEELGKHIGPMSPNPEKLLIVDGEPQSLDPKTGAYISYFVIQAYSGTQGSPSFWSMNMANLDARLKKLLDKFTQAGEDGNPVLTEEQITNRTVMTENLEPAMEALNGGYKFYDRNGMQMFFDAAHKEMVPSMVGMAMWEPTNGFRKGGFGAYKFSNEGVNKPAFKWMRKAIQVQNPAVN